MKIVILHNLFGKDARGGAETVVAASVLGFIKAGHDVVVVTPGEMNGWERMKEGYLVRRVKLPLGFLYRDLAKHSFLARAWWHFRDVFDPLLSEVVTDVVAEIGPDVVYTHNMMGLGFGTMRVISGRWKHVHTVHDVQLVWSSGLVPAESTWGLWSRTKYWVHAFVMRLVVGSPETVLFPSRFLLDFYSRFGFFQKSKKEVVRNDVSIEKVERLEKVGGVGFVYVGLLESHKGVRLLLDVWSDVIAKAKCANDVPVLRIVGDGVLMNEVVVKAAELNRVVREEKIFVLGRLGKDEVMKEYVRASWTIVPSVVIENSPTVILESLAVGTPVIAAAVGGIPELIRDGENGVLFEVGSRRALYKAVQWAMRTTL